MMEDDEVEVEGVAEVPPIAELNDFELPTDEEFTDQVRRSIGRREATSHVVDLSIRGFFRLLLDYLSTIFEDLFSPRDPEDGEKEP
jgi:hypothetical protein